MRLPLGAVLLLSAAPAVAQAPAAPPPDASQDVALHCRPEALEAFLGLFDAMEGYAEEALTVSREGEALRFVRAQERREDFCQSVRVDGNTVAIAHTHPDQSDAVQIPVGADCDTRQPNYVLTRDALYVTVVKPEGARLFRATGEDEDLGRYRQVLGREWRRRESWSDPRWQARCVERALSERSSGRTRRCHYDPEQARRYRNAGGSPPPCKERPAPR